MAEDRLVRRDIGVAGRGHHGDLVLGTERVQAGIDAIPTTEIDDEAAAAAILEEAEDRVR